MRSILSHLCHLWLAAALLLPAPLAASAQQPRPPKPPGEAVRIGTEEVLLDVIVRDRRGRPVNDLRADEIEVYEDGARQQVSSFRRVERASAEVAAPGSRGAGATAASGETAPVDPLRQINLVTMVFERLNHEARPLARDSALEFLRAELNANVRIAIFAIDQRLRIVEPFTNDRDRLAKAVARASDVAAPQFADQSEAIRRALEQEARSQEQGEAATANVGPGGPGASAGASFAAAKLAQMTVNMLRQSDDAQRQQQGAATLHALLSLIREQRRLAGRKTILYFSEGLQMAPSQTDLLRASIGEANRANVSFYAIDARGLLSARTTDAARESLAAATRASESQMRSRGNQPVTPEQVKVFDNAESAMSKNAQENLRQLAESTGGFLVANTNDLRTPMRRVAAELSNYYELSYTPPPREPDGRFRRIEVRVTRPEAAVQTRSGYFALPPGEIAGVTPQPYELPLLAALGASPLPREFDYRAQALRFNTNAAGEVQHVLLMEVPLSNFTFHEEKERGVYRLRFALLALVKNAEGRIVQKVSQDFPLEGPSATLEARRRANAVLSREVWLPPGRYTLETIARDGEAGRASARRAVLMVPAARPGVRLSSLSVIKRVDQAGPAGAEAESPLRVASGRIVPNLGDPLTLGAGASVSLYFIVYISKESQERPQLALEFLQDGQTVAQAAPQLPEPDAEGRIPFVASVPLENFKAGLYQVRAVVRQSGQAVEEYAFFTIVPEK